MAPERWKIFFTAGHRPPLFRQICLPLKQRRTCLGTAHISQGAPSPLQKFELHKILGALLGEKFHLSNAHHRSTTARATQVNIQGKFVKAGHHSLNADTWSAEATLPCERFWNVAGMLQEPSPNGWERFTSGNHVAGAFYDGEAWISSAFTRCFSVDIEVAERFRNFCL